ncbi:DegT/DnrJ/EryC1/StrS family aminotransferase [Parabacteroides sp. OttesenSCG-928-N08]|nr:DegT/DnrJ/EryC1/StrS family aminotransferase [Parabacteroides sp. OttesenSCG-928-N08]
MQRKEIGMADLTGQYQQIKEEIDAAIQSVIDSSAFINGRQVKEFSEQLAAYLNVKQVVPCGNGTDALQIALMGLGLQAGDEVIVPAFTYAAAVEVIALLGMTPVVVDVQQDSFNIDPESIRRAISKKTKAIIVVHLFGQSCDMDPILSIAKENNLYVVEDNAQSIGAEYTFPDGKTQFTGTMGDIGTTSFFPTKPLACYGDGGAMISNNQELAEKVKMIAQHGQSKKYQHQVIGCNSRLDTMQAAILQVKLQRLEAYRTKTQLLAKRYDEELQSLPWLIVPKRSPFSSHVYHQYTIRVEPEKRDDLQRYLKNHGIASMVYYPLAIQEQQAFRNIIRMPEPADRAIQLSRSVLSLPIHTELSESDQQYIIRKIKAYEER